LFPFAYLHAAVNPSPESGGVRLSILLRGAGGALLGILTIIHHPPGAAVYFAAAGVDLAWAAVHAGLAARAKKKAAVV
jgi:hypothetical protein